jgi:hypothetical protein
MPFVAVRPEIQQRLAIFVPIIALVLSLFVVYPAWGRYGELNQKIAQQQSQLRDLKATPVVAPGPVAPTAADLPSEPPQFLGEMRKMATEANCRVVGFDITPSDKATTTGPVRAVRAKIDLEARYVQVRDFLYQLDHAARLYVVTDLTMTAAAPVGAQSAATASPNVPAASAGLLHATIEIERYVAPPAAKTSASSA